MNVDVNEKMTILYTIKGIQPYQFKKEHVAILLSPVDPLEAPVEKTIRSNPKIIGMGPDGPMPPEAAEQIQNMMESMFGMKKKREGDRDIVIIESDHVFRERGWKYGDTIQATFEKTE